MDRFGVDLFEFCEIIFKRNNRNVIYYRNDYLTCIRDGSMECMSQFIDRPIINFTVQ